MAVKKNKTLVVIDGKSVFYRGYYAMPNLANKEGVPTGGVYGFAMMALKVLHELNPDYVAVAWDKSKTSTRARKEIYEEYKANRKPMPEDMRQQIPYLRKVIDAFNWPFFEIDDYEADDIAGALAVQANQHDVETIIVTGDHDILQLVNSHTKAMILKRGVTNFDMYDGEAVEERYGIGPDKFPDYKALRGDSSDNIPGVKGVGKKTARKLLEEYESLDNIYENIDEIKGAVQKKLIRDKDMAYKSKELVLLHTDLPIEFNLQEANAKNSKPKEIYDVFQELQFSRLLKELPEYMRKRKNTLFDQKPTSEESLDLPKVHKVVSKDQLKEFSLDKKEAILHAFTEENKETRLPELTSLLIAPDEENLYLFDLNNAEYTPEALYDKLNEYFSSDVDLSGYHIKHTIKTLLAAGVKIKRVDFDILIAAFLLNPLIRQQKLTQIAFNELGFNEELSVKTYTSHKQAAKVSALLWKLNNIYKERIKEDEKLYNVMKELELSLIPLLARIEIRGVKLDSEFCERMSEELAKRIEAIESDVHEYASKKFNLSSPQQLQEVLYEQLELPTTDIKKTKTGYSTAASELEKLVDLHPIVKLIMEYRELTKLKSTYVDTLPQLTDKNDRLHTTLNQTVTQTGRLSSDNPNLQNIPIRTELGRKLRKAFIADEGNTLISADYSQFELRLAAALAGDEDMIESFNQGADIHTKTAAELYDISPDDVTKQQRDSIKVVNFGILYGMSPHGLSQATDMNREEAKEFIDRYFEIRKDLTKYLENLVEQAKKDGYVETLFGRRRPMPDIHSRNYAVREAAKRAAMNMPIQGTEADLMKMAMIKLDDKLDDDCRQILQIHDSILVECPEQKAEDTAKLMKEVMENIYELPVNLDVEVRTGKNWGEM